MFIELLDLLRCPKPHEDTCLVASFKKVSHRFVETGTLGCPVCEVQYPIENGVADFTGGISSSQCEEQRNLASHGREELATRVGAFLDATEPGATIVLGGVWAYGAEQLADLAQVRVVALNPEPHVKETARVGLVRVAADIPLAPESCLGAALDAWFNAGIIPAAVRVVRPGGRIVGPVAIPPTADLSVLAQDADYWVARTAPRVIPLRRANR